MRESKTPKSMSESRIKEKYAEKPHSDLIQEILMLREDIEALEVDHNSFVENAFREAKLADKLKGSMRKSMKEAQMEIEKGKKEKYELEARIEKLENQLKMRESKTPKSMFESRIKDLEEELKKQAEGHEADLKSKKLKDQEKYAEKPHSILIQEILRLKADNSCVGDAFREAKLADELKDSMEKSVKETQMVIEKGKKEKSELEAQIEKLGNELKMRERENSKSLSTINKLESRIKDLEEELEKQAEGYAADLEALSHAKDEQEQRAVRAEETLRKKRQNADTAERLQEDFRRLSLQMGSTFEANEKLAKKALMEANEFRLQRANLEEMLRKANEEIESLKDHYEVIIHELSSQVISLSEEIKNLESEIEENKSMELEDQEEYAEKSHSILTEEIQMLKEDIEALLVDYKSLSEYASREAMLTDELKGSMQKSMKETEMLIEKGKKEKSELESRIAIMKKDVEQTYGELCNERISKEEKESILAKLQAEVVNLKAQHDELKLSLYEEELEKEKLRREVDELKDDVKKKEDTVMSLEKKLKDNNSLAAGSDGVEPSSIANNPYGTKDIANLKENIRRLRGQIKQKEAALENSTNSFLKKVKDLQNQNEELAERLKMLNQNEESYGECKCSKVHIEGVANGSEIEEVRDAAQCIGPKASISNENKSATSSSTCDAVLDKGSKASTPNKQDLDALSDEVALLREQKKSVEEELKELRERYAEISLKYAEAVGEIQKLVKELLDLKKAEKS